MKREPLMMLMLAFAGTSPTHAASRADATVAIRTYNYAQVSTERLATARTTADRIFHDAGISLEWIDCRVPQSESGAACTTPLSEGRDLALRLRESAQDDSGNTTRIFALGTSMIDRERGGGVMMTVDVSAIRTIVGTTLLDVSAVLGRAIAHEIGHLLLGTPDHPTGGLMRARWSQDELRGLKPSHWRFSSREAAQMLRRIGR